MSIKNQQQIVLDMLKFHGLELKEVLYSDIMNLIDDSYFAGYENGYENGWRNGYEDSCSTQSSDEEYLK